MITAQQLDAVLPRTPAGLALASLDPTDDEDRQRIIADLLDLFWRAEAQTTPRNAAHVHWGVSQATVGLPPPKPTDTRYHTHAGPPLPDPTIEAIIARIRRTQKAR